MEALFQTKRMIALPAEAKDIPFIIYMENDPANRNFIWQGTEEQHRAEIADPAHILAVFRGEDGRNIGYMLCHLDRKSEVFELRRIAIDAKGQGYGREAMEGTMRFAFETLRINRFWLDVYPDNAVGIRLYESLGMHRDGMLRQSYKSERGYLDQIIYSMLKGEYFARNSAVPEADWLLWKQKAPQSLETERLLLRQVTEADFEKVHSVLGDPEVMYAWEHGFSEEETRAWIAQTLARYEEDGFGHYAVEVRETGEFVGVIGLIREKLCGYPLLGIGWMLRKACWGNGYATEAAGAVIRDAFDHLHVKEILADIRPENTASRRLAERLGMKAEYEIVKRYRGKDMVHIVHVIKTDLSDKK